MSNNYSDRNAYCATYDIIHFREEPIDYGDLDTALRKTCAKMNLKDVEGNLILLLEYSLIQQKYKEPWVLQAVRFHQVV